MSGLPLDMIIDILSRLRVKSLLRFRCVSKSWCFLIDTPYFVKTHLTRSIENDTNLTIIFRAMSIPQNKNTLYSLDFHSLQTPIPFNNHFNNCCVSGSCNGLLLLKPQDQNVLVLFNPSTRQHRNVPAAPIKYPICYANYVVEHFGLGYDSFEHDYKVIRFVEFYESLKWVKTEAEVYSLKLNLWRKIGDFPYRFPDGCISGWGTQVSGALHTVVTEGDLDSSQLIVGFHVADENFYLVPKPDFMKKEDVDLSVDVLGGCLCLMGSYSDYTDVWVMKVYEVKKSWTKLLSILSPEFRSYVSFRPLGFSKSRDEILLNFNANNLIWYDLKSRDIRNVKICGLTRMFYVEVCVESIVPLDGYGGSGEPKKQYKE